MLPQKEIIYGVCPAKANHYLSVPASDGGRRIIKDDVVRNYEQSFNDQCHIYKNRKIDRDFHLVVDVYYPSNRFDLDNSLKTILDCLQYTSCIIDDNRCVKIDAAKHIDPIRPRVELSIIETEPTLFD